MYIPAARASNYQQAMGYAKQIRHNRGELTTVLKQDDYERAQRQKILARHNEARMSRRTA